MTYDAIIIGAGHNGLVCAAYLAKAGKKVVVLERRDIVGGAAVTEEIFPGYKCSRASYVNSLFRPKIIKDLALKSFGLEFIPRQPASFSPFPDGSYLMLGSDMVENQKEVAKFSTNDEEAYPNVRPQYTAPQGRRELGPTRDYLEEGIKRRAKRRLLIERLRTKELPPGRLRDDLARLDKRIVAR